MQTLVPRLISKIRRTNLPLQARLTRRRSRSSESGDGRTPVTEREMLVNFSFVLHQPSTSPDVAAAARAGFRKHPVSSNPAIMFDGDPDVPVEMWLVPSVGLPDNVALHVEGPVLHVDRGVHPASQAMFFNAPAMLSLPSNNVEIVGVAALIRRPGSKSLQLIARGPYLLTDGIDAVIRSLETIIQSHAEQWSPGAQLWAEPAEDLLPELSLIDHEENRGRSAARMTSYE